jgi:shikimate kinase
MGLPNNIILIGFMGSGKTSTGKELGKLLEYNFWDMDQWIEEKNKKNISNIFTEKGEEYFRSQESEAVDWLKGKQRIIASTGGGSWVNQANREKLLKLGWCVWLKVSAEKALERIGMNLSQRPVLAQSKKPLIEINNILSFRNQFYSLAHTSVATDKKKPKEVALEILKILKEDQPFDLPSL